jgi:proteic killer suppression protein
LKSFKVDFLTIPNEIRHFFAGDYIDIRYNHIVIRTIGDATTQDIFDGENSKAARKLPRELHDKARRLLDLINSAVRLDDLRIPPGNRLEALKGDYKGFHSIRIYDQWRIVFEWLDGHADSVQIVDYH